MKLYLICVTTYLFTLLIESSTPTWLRVITGISLGILCAVKQWPTNTCLKSV